MRPELLVCTPGRLIDVIDSYDLDLSEVNYFVLDEGDRMLDMGFQDAIVEIQDKIAHDDVRSMIFSATVPAFIQKIAEECMDNPVMVDLVGDDSNQLPATIRNKAIITSDFDNKLAHIQRFVQENRDKKILIFTETKSEARQFESQEFANFLPIHGDLE